MSAYDSSHDDFDPIQDYRSRLLGVVEGVRVYYTPWSDYMTLTISRGEIRHVNINTDNLKGMEEEIAHFIRAERTRKTSSKLGI